jgi:hypothetical protein
MSQPDLDQLLRAVRALPRPGRLRLVESVVHDLAAEGNGSPTGKSVLGLFADDAKLIDEVCDAAMTSRERDPLRR